MAVSTWDRVQMAKYSAYRWRCEASLTKKMALAVGMAAVVGLAAQVRIPLPFVPITGQTLAVLLAGVLMGRNWGGVSMAIYAVLGVAGVPWFNGWTGGLGAIAGPTGGYIIGFIPAAMLMGYFTDKYVRARSFTAMFGLMLVANFIVIYIPGLLQLNLWLNLVNGLDKSWLQVLSIGLFPFIAGDVVKIGFAALIARGVTTKQAYNGETDRDQWRNRRLP